MTEESAAENYPKAPSIQPEAPAPAGPPPATVSRAVMLMYLSAALGVIGLILAIASRDTIKERLLESNPNIENVDAVVTGTVVFSIVIGLIFIALWIWLAMMVSKGRNWARIVTWVIAGLGAIFAVVALVNPNTALDAVLAVIEGLVDIAVIVLLAMRPSNEFFARRPPA